MRTPILSTLLLLLAAPAVLADISSQQARKLISRVGGSDLPTSAIRVRRVSAVTSSSAEATADIQTAFRLEQTAASGWVVREVRVGPDRWESISLIATAMGTELKNSCDEKDRRAGRLAPAIARCLIAEVLATTLPSDAVRIKTISPLILPLADRPSATVEAVVQLDFRFGTQKGKGWQVTDVRSGGREWFSVERLFAAVNEEKRKGALTDLSAVGEALEKYRAVRGSYVITDRHEVLIDHLAPRFLSQIIRLDPWHHSYHYQGEGARFTLRSVGPDGKPNTPDDISFSRP